MRVLGKWTLGLSSDSYFLRETSKFLKERLTLRFTPEQKWYFFKEMRIGEANALGMKCRMLSPEPEWVPVPSAHEALQSAQQRHQAQISKL